MKDKTMKIKKHKKDKQQEHHWKKTPIIYKPHSLGFHQDLKTIEPQPSIIKIHIKKHQKPHSKINYRINTKHSTYDAHIT